MDNSVGFATSFDGKITTCLMFDQNELKIRETKFFSKKKLFQNSMLALVQSN